MSQMSPAFRIVFVLVAMILLSPVVIGKAEEQQQLRVYDCGGLGERACNTDDYGWLANGGHSCDAHLAERIADGICVENEYIPFKRRQGVGMNFRQSWAGNALRTQSRNINRFTPIDQVPQISVHNAYDNVADGYLEAATQRYSITEMLDAGFRHIELDVHETLFHDLRLSHGGTAAPAAGDRSPHNVFKEIRQWMLEPGNLKETLIIQVENWITDYSADKIAHWNDPIKTFLDTPDIGVWNFTQTSPYLQPPDQWPSQEEMVREGKRVIFIQFGQNVPNINPYVYAIGNLSRDMNVQYQPSTNECPPWSRGADDPNLVTASFTGLAAKFSDIFYADVFPGSRPNAVEIAHYTRCAVDSLKVNRLLDPDYNVARLGAAIWTWAELEPFPSARPTAAFLDWDSRRWKTSDRDSQRPFLCGKGDPISLRLATTATGGTAMGKWSDGFAACNQDGYSFWVPRNGPEAELAVMLNQDVWLNFAPDSTGEWVVSSAPTVSRPFVETFASRFKRGQTVTFSTSAKDADLNAKLLNEHLTISWDFGDGTMVTDSDPQPFFSNTTRRSLVDHAFAAAGIYTIKVSVRDSVGIVDESSIEFEVSGASAPGIDIQGPTGRAGGTTGSYVLFGLATDNDPVSVVSITCGDQPPVTQGPNELAPPNANILLHFTCLFPLSFVETSVTATIGDVDGTTTETLVVKNVTPPTGVISGPAHSGVGKSELYFVTVTGSGSVTSVTGACGPHGTLTGGPTQIGNQFGIKCRFTASNPGNPVSFTFTDGTGLTGSAETLVEIEATDTTPPTLDLAGNVTIEATRPDGATYAFDASARDAIDGDVHVRCTPSSGSLFEIDRITTVECSATDSSENTATGSFTVTVQDTTPPAVTVPAPIDEPATGAATKVDFSVLASDAVDGTDVPVTCSPASGSSFPVGKTQVTCSATDAHDNRSADKMFYVTVTDGLAPALSLPANIKQEAEGPGGATVTFAATATDNVDASVAVSCSPASGARFEIDATTSRTTTVECSATDSSHNTKTGSFTVTVVDTTPPDVTVPDDITVPANGTSAVVTFSASASDLVDGVGMPVQCSPASGAAFPVGKTRVACSSTDRHDNSAGASFEVTVVDRTPPVLSVADVTAEATGPDGAAVIYAATAVDAIDPHPAVTCVADVTGGITPSGSVFPLGVTQMACEATDASGNKNAATFTVAVRDTIAPTVSYRGNAGSYQADQTVSIQCAAADGGSGVASTTCADIAGPAAMFNAGTNVHSATATDAAGNIGHGSASFTVVVSATALQSLVSRFSTSADVAAGLNAKLAAAAKATNANARAGQLGAFANQVRAQTGKALTTDAANTLLRLVAALN